MPYETKRSRDAKEWITLSEAVHYVASVENVRPGPPPSKDDPSAAPKTNSFLAVEGETISFKWTPFPPHLADALKQILLALQDEEIPIKWAAERRREGSWPLHRNLLFDPDEPRTDRYFWSTAIITEDYEVRDHMVQLGSLILDGVETNPDRGLRTLLLLQSRVYGLWPNKALEDLRSDVTKKATISPDVIRTEARNLYCNLDPKPNIARAEKLIREVLPYAKRDSIRDVLNELEFASQRRPAGNSKTRR